MNVDTKPLLPMPIKVGPYQHQIEAFNFVCGLFGLLPGGDSHAESGMCDVRKADIPEAVRNET